MGSAINLVLAGGNSAKISRPSEMQRLTTEFCRLWLKKKKRSSAGNSKRQLPGGDGPNGTKNKRKEYDFLSLQSLMIYKWNTGWWNNKRWWNNKHEIALKVHRKCANKCMMSWDQGFLCPLIPLPTPLSSPSLILPRLLSSIWCVGNKTRTRNKSLCI